MAGKKAIKTNPFHIQGRIRNSKFFYGRNKELTAIWDFLRKGENVSIVGKRKLGKSSLLWYIKEKAVDVLKNSREPGIEVFYMDMETIRCEEEFFDWLAGELELNTEHPTSRDLERKLEGKQVILCLDEFDHTAYNDNFSEDFFGILRGLSQGENLTLVVSTKIPLKDYSERGMTSPLYNIFPPMPIILKPFAKEEAEELLKGIAALEGKAFPERDLRDALETVKDYYPWNVQYMGWCWFESGFNIEKAIELYRDGLANMIDRRSTDQQPEEISLDPGVSTHGKGSDWIAFSAVILTFLLVLMTFYTIMSHDKGMVWIDITIAASVAALFVLNLFKTRRKGNG